MTIDICGNKFDKMYFLIVKILTDKNLDISDSLFGQKNNLIIQLGAIAMILLILKINNK